MLSHRGRLSLTLMGLSAQFPGSVNVTLYLRNELHYGISAVQNKPTKVPRGYVSAGHEHSVLLKTPARALPLPVHVLPNSRVGIIMHGPIFLENMASR